MNNEHLAVLIVFGIPYVISVIIILVNWLKGDNYNTPHFAYIYGAAISIFIGIILLIAGVKQLLDYLL